MKSQQQADREEQQRIKNLVLNYEMANDNEPANTEGKYCLMQTWLLWPNQCWPTPSSRETPTTPWYQNGQIRRKPNSIPLAKTPAQRCQLVRVWYRDDRLCFCTYNTIHNTVQYMHATAQGSNPRAFVAEAKNAVLTPHRIASHYRVTHLLCAHWLWVRILNRERKPGSDGTWWHVVA